MNEIAGQVISVHVGAPDVLEKASCAEIEVTLDGIVGDRHRGLSRTAWAESDKQAAGTLRRNERMWSAISEEELSGISSQMGLPQPLAPDDIGVNLCVAGIVNFSRLPRGTVLSFSSGAVLLVEEYNPPCLDMGERLAERFRSKTEETIAVDAFSQAAKFSRGLVGIVEVPGLIRRGDKMAVVLESLPKWLR